MPRLLQAATLLVATLALAGCCRDTVREMASLKDVRETPPRRERSAARSEPQQETKRSARVDKDDDDDDDVSAIETGSIAKPTCQGQHLAYQATKEYLKNFGPRPADEPGERGPCTPSR